MPEASFVVQVKNPDTPTPPYVGLGNRQKPSYPENLKRVFHGRRFVSGELHFFLRMEFAPELL
jgi:hypothetical protein